MPHRIAAVGLVLAWLLAASAYSENWPQWRGPFLNGSSPETNLPARWGHTENIAWATPLPGRSGATPVVWSNAVFVPSPDSEKNLWLLCLDQTTGAIRWQQRVGTGDRTNGKNNMASCSPVTDGQRVYALFGTSDLAAFDFSGKPLWHRKLSDEFGVFAILFLYGASPLLYEDKLYVPLLQRNPPTYAHAQAGPSQRQSWLICLDPKTGRTWWRQERRSDAQEEAMEAYTTPVPFPGRQGVELILVGADCVTAHRPDTGAEVWRFAGLNARKNPGGRIVPSPVVAPGLVFVCGPKREVLVALRPNGAPIVGPEQVAWKKDQYVPDVCTPLYYQNRLFVLDGDRQTMTCVVPATGEQLWQGKLGIREIFSASPTGADGKIYCLSEEGTVVVLSAGEKFDLIATLPMGEGPCQSSIVAADGRLFIRTAQHLYCVQSPRKEIR